MPTIGVDARSLLCKEPRGEGKSLLRLYAEILRERPDIKVWFFGDTGAKSFSGDLPQGIRIDTTPSWGYRIDGWENFTLPWRAWRRGCEVLHCASSSAPRWSPMPVVMTVHDMIPALRIDGQSRAESRQFLRRVCRGMKQARSVIAVSHQTRKDIIRYFPDMGSTVAVVHWGCDRVPPLSANLPAKSPYLIAFGGFAPRKNTSYLLQRFAAVSRLFPGLRLIITGISNSGKRETLLKLADSLNIRSLVEIVGYVSDEEIDGLLRDARALLFLSTYEGFGLPVLDAIARGVPVVASNSSSLPEILGSAPGCFDLDEPEKLEVAIVQLLIDQDLRMQWIAAQNHVLESFRWSSTAQMTLNHITPHFNPPLGH